MVKLREAGPTELRQEIACLIYDVIKDKVLAKELRNACKHGFREGAAYATEVLLRKQKK